MALAALALALLAPPQEDTDILGVPEWHGWVRFTIVNNGSAREEGEHGESTVTTWTLNDSLYVDLKLDRRAHAPFYPAPALTAADKGRYQSWSTDTKHKDPHLVQTRLDASSRILAVSAGEAKSPIIDTDTVRFGRSAVGQTRLNFVLQVDRTAGTYMFAVPKDAPLLPTPKSTGEHVHRHQQIVTGVDTTTTQPATAPPPLTGIDPRSLAAITTIGDALPRGVPELKGSRRFPLTPAVPLPRNAKVDLYAEVSWSFSPKPPDRYTLEFEAVPQGGGAYAAWRPEAGPNEATPGNVLTVTATLNGPQTANSDRLSKLSLRLTEVSREKGVSINFPVNPPAPQPDFRFIPSAGPQVKVSDVEAYTTDDTKTTLTVDLGAYDGGAWGELTAECELQSGRFVQGTVKGTLAPRLLLPARHPSSKIALSWNAPGPDDADDDAQPPGDSAVKGDGLTNYEEYRGFHVQGRWKPGDASRKDFFVRDTTGGLAAAGLGLFESLSKLRLHRLDGVEFPTSRVINENHTLGPRRVDQHGILIQHDPAFGPYCEAQSPTRRPTTPKNITRVVLGQVPTLPVTANVSGGRPVPLTYDAPSVAHELFHCVNVWHHGDFPDEGIRTWTKDPRGAVLEASKPVAPVDESGAPISPASLFGPASSIQIDLGRMNGMYSGDPGCVMRYDSAQGRFDPGAAARIVFTAPEIVGGGLCTGKDGTPPNTRFGPAVRGNCAGQIHVNDAVPPRAR